MLITAQPARAFTLEDVRSRATSLYVLIAWLHVPAAALIALTAHNAWSGPAIVLAVCALIATLSARFLPSGIAQRSIVAIVLTAAPIVFVYAGRGDASGFLGRGDWQIDYHMYFFAIFAMLAGYVDWRPIVISAGLTAVHHLIFDLVVPAAVFPEEGLDRVALHAICVVAECSVLIWITQTIKALFFRIDELMDFTTKATAEAIAESMAERAVLEAELLRVRGFTG